MQNICISVIAKQLQHGNGTRLIRVDLNPTFGGTRKYLPDNRKIP